MDDRFAGTEYLVKQRVTPVANLYRVFAGTTDGGQGPLVAFVRQKRLKMKEEIIFFADESQQQPLFQIKARKVIDLRGRYDVTDPAGYRIGVFGKLFAASLGRSSWAIYDPTESTEVVRVQERSVPIAVLRRVWGMIPYADSIPFPIRYHFDFVSAGRVVATYDKITTFRDHYRLAIVSDIGLDRRVYLAVGVALDALQSR